MTWLSSIVKSSIHSSFHIVHQICCQSYWFLFKLMRKSTWNYSHCWHKSSADCENQYKSNKWHFWRMNTISYGAFNEVVGKESWSKHTSSSRSGNHVQQSSAIKFTLNLDGPRSEQFPSFCGSLSQLGYFQSIKLQEYQQDCWVEMYIGIINLEIETNRQHWECFRLHKFGGSVASQIWWYDQVSGH